MTLQTNCQTTSNATPTIQYVKVGDDTVIQMNSSDAKRILESLLDAEIADSLLNIYITRDSINTKIIEMQVNEIRLLQEKSNNQELFSKNLAEIIQNKNNEVDILNETIDSQKKEIRKQKLIKTIALIGDVALPVILLIILL